MSHPGPPFKKCRYCGKVNSYFGKCPSCGDRVQRSTSSLPSLSSIPSTPDYSFDVPEVHCDSCGELISGDDIHRLPFDDVEYYFSYCEWCCKDVAKKVKPFVENIEKIENNKKNYGLHINNDKRTKADKIRELIETENFIGRIWRKKQKRLKEGFGKGWRNKE